MEIAVTGNLTMYYNIQSVFCANCGMYYAKITKMIKLYIKLNRGQWGGTDNQLYKDDLLFRLLYTVSSLLHDPNSTRIDKIHLLISNSPLLEGNIITIWRNNVGHILLESMIDSTVCNEVLTNPINSNTIYHMVVPFILINQLLTKGTISDKEEYKVKHNNSEILCTW